MSQSNDAEMKNEDESVKKETGEKKPMVDDIEMTDEEEEERKQIEEMNKRRLQKQAMAAAM